MNILKIFFLKIFLFILPFYLFSESKVEIFRSNSNGLALLKIRYSQRNEYKFILYEYYTDSVKTRKVLYADGVESKRWLYYYTDDYLSIEKYLKEQELREDYRYDSQGHKIKQTDYKSNKKIRITTYSYNKDGLVDVENIFNVLTGKNAIVKYRYDSAFRIKQIEKRFPDGRLIFWEAFFTDRGIIQKEFYTLEEERFTFWYNKKGQEIKGEVKQIGQKEEVKKEWENFYKKSGKKDKKIEKNYLLGRKILTWYNSNFKESRKEIYKDDIAESIEIFDYNEDNNITYYEIIKNLSSSKVLYNYDKEDKDRIVKSLHYEDDALKKIVNFKKDNSRTEVLYSKRNKKIIVEYDDNGKMISQSKK